MDNLCLSIGIYSNGLCLFLKINKQLITPGNQISNYDMWILKYLQLIGWKDLSTDYTTPTVSVLLQFQVFNAGKWEPTSWAHHHEANINTRILHNNKTVEQMQTL